MQVIKRHLPNAVLKSIILSIAVFCNFDYAWGQLPIEIYTPQGSKVTVYERIDEISEAEKEAQKQYFTQKYPNAELCENPYAGDASFLVEPNTFTGVRFYEMGIYTVTVTGRRTDSWHDYTFSKDFTITEVSDKRPGTP